MKSTDLRKAIIKRREGMENDDSDSIPKTLVLSSRCDLRDVATIGNIFDLLDIRYRSASSLIGIAIRNYAQILAQAHQGRFDMPIQISTTGEAAEFMRKHPRLYTEQLFRTKGRYTGTRKLQMEDEARIAVEIPPIDSEELDKRVKELEDMKGGEEGEK